MISGPIATKEATVVGVPTTLTGLLSFIFFFSGYSALIYQVVWQRLLTVHYGVGAISITLVVSIYMLGLGVGALIGGFLAERVNNKITLYFCIELLIGLLGLISLPVLDLLGRHTAGSSYLISLLCMVSFLGFPTLLMGATLPLLTKIFNTVIQNFLHTVSFLYFINTIGASIGALSASYVIISFFGLNGALYIAAGINFILAILILLARRFKVDPQETEYPPELREGSYAKFGKVAYLLVFTTGLLAIGYEIVWFRVVGVLVKASPYAFSSILSVYLLGLAIGSFGVNRFLKSQNAVDRRSLFLFLQFLIGASVAAIFLGYFYLTEYTVLGRFTEASFGKPLHPTFAFPSLHSGSEFLKDIYYLTDIFLWPLVFAFIPTIFMGASFPLISSLALSKHDQEGKTVGTVYFFSIAGNVVGGVVTGFLLLPFLGTELTILVFSAVGLLFGFFVSRVAGRRWTLAQRTVVVVSLFVVVGVFFPRPGELYEAMHSDPGNEFTMYLEEGIDGTVVTFQHGETVLNYINGLAHGFRPGYGFRGRALTASSYTRSVQNVLVLGYGTGSIVEIVLMMDEVRKLTLVELNRSVIQNLRKMTVFSEMLADNRLDLIIDDGRRFLLRTDEKFDFVLIDPLRTTTAYSNNLYSREFFELIESRLTNEGIFYIWFDEKKVLPNTVGAVFDYLRVYDSFALASNRPFERNDARYGALVESFAEGERERILESLEGQQFLGGTGYIEETLAEYPINEDWNPVTEYYLGLKFIEED